MDFTNKTIWITGATSGIGKAVAEEISHHKCRLILSGRNEAALAETGKNCERNGSSVQLILFDLGSEQSIEEAVAQVLSTNENIDCLYHFGGISQRSFVAETPVEVDRKIFEINFFGTVVLTKAVLPKMIEKGEGYIAVTSSIVGKFGFPYRSAYSASKHALHGYFESLRAENTKHIKVSIIIPGRIKTNISLNALNKNGLNHGVMDKGQEKGMEVGKAAKLICRKLKKEKREILVGGNELVMLYLKRFMPALHYRLATKVQPL